jgi:tetratricopeptide (TPR) repeat protein
MPTNAVASKATKIETTKEDLHYTTGERELKKADHFAAIHQPDKAMEYYMLCIEQFKQTWEGRKKFSFERLLDKPLKIAPIARQRTQNREDVLKLATQMEFLSKLYNVQIQEPKNAANALKLALSFVDSVKPSDLKAVTRISMELAQLYVNGKKFDDASPILERILPILRNKEPKGDSLVLALGLYEEVLRHQGKFSQSERIGLERASLSIEQGQKYHNHQVEMMKGGEGEKF